MSNVGKRRKVAIYLKDDTVVEYDFSKHWEDDDYGKVYVRSDHVEILYFLKNPTKEVIIFFHWHDIKKLECQNCD